jgi:hypothetical protein
LIQYIQGRAELPVNTDLNTLILHVCNNARRWGAGFTNSIDQIFPEVGREFVSKQRELGTINLFILEEFPLAYGNMVAMDGVRSINNPHPLKMDHLRTCLEKAYGWSVKNDYVIQMPMIGSGLANGKWDEISELIEEVIPDLVTVVTL